MPTAKRTFGMVETVYRLSGRDGLSESSSGPMAGSWEGCGMRQANECFSRLEQCYCDAVGMLCGIAVGEEDVPVS